MAYDNVVYEWEGDPTQPFGTMQWESPEVVHNGRIRLSVARILFDVGDLQAFYDTVLAREEIIARNAAKLASGQLGTTGGSEGGYIFGKYPIAGDNLEAVPAAPTYGGTLDLTFKLYADGNLKFTKTIYTNKIFKLAGGYRGQKWIVSLTGNVDKVQRVDVASSVEEILKRRSQGG